MSSVCFLQHFPTKIMLPKQMETFNKLRSVSLDMTPKLYCEMYILRTGFVEFQLDLFWNRYSRFGLTRNGTGSGS